MLKFKVGDLVTVWPTPGNRHGRGPEVAPGTLGRIENVDTRASEEVPYRIGFANTCWWFAEQELRPAEQESAAPPREALDEAIAEWQDRDARTIDFEHTVFRIHLVRRTAP